MRRVEAKQLTIVGVVLLVPGIVLAFAVSGLFGGLLILLSLVAFGVVAVQSAKATRARAKGDSDEPDFPEQKPSSEDDEDGDSEDE